jgi:transcriptional regulator with XRE-family HTH domain
VCRCEPAVLRSVEQFRAAIEAAGCSQRALASAAGVTRGFVNQLATARRAGCTGEVAGAIAGHLAEHLGLGVDEVLDQLFAVSHHAGQTG